MLVTAEMWLIALVRLAGALPVLRWPFYGALIAMLVDGSDLFIMNLVHLGGVTDYQAFDKYLDQAYMLTFLLVAWRWQGARRNVALALYGYRFAGFIAFEVTQDRGVLLFFPNFFEPWFLLITATDQFRLDTRLPRMAFVAAGAVLVALKLLQEYAFHHARWLDNVTAVEVVEDAWRLLTPF